MVRWIAMIGCFLGEALLPSRATLATAGSALLVVLSVLAVSAGGSPAGAQTSPLASARTVVILDGSGSMWGSVGRTAKIALARRALKRVLEPRTAGAPIGLVAYGHRRKRSCSDVEVVVEPRRGNGAELTSAIDDLAPRGRTPLASALETAFEQLQEANRGARRQRGVGGGASGTVILVTDGAENCRRDPCAVVRDARAQAPAVQFHVIALSMKDKDRSAVQCVANLGGGRIFDAATVDAIAEGLESIFEMQAPLRGLATAPTASAIGETEPGGNDDPQTATAAASARALSDFAITRVGASRLNLRAQAMAAGGVIDDDLEWRITRVSETHALVLRADVLDGLRRDGQLTERRPLLPPTLPLRGEDGAQAATSPPAAALPHPSVEDIVLTGADSELVHSGIAPGVNIGVPPGRYLVMVRWGLASRAALIDVRATDEVLARLTIDAGRIQLSALANSSGEKLSSVFYTLERLDAVDVAAAAASGESGLRVLDRNRATTQTGARAAPSVTTGLTKVVAMSHDDTPEFQIPPGLYRASVRYGFVRGSRLVEVKNGTARRIDVVLGVGRLQLSATTGDGTTRPDGVLFRVLEDDPSSPLGRREVARSSAPQPEFLLRAGVFYASAQRGTVSVEQPVTVFPGQLTDAALRLPASTIQAKARIAGAAEPVDDNISYTVYQVPEAGAGGAPERAVLRTSVAEPTLRLGAGTYRVVGVLGGVNAAIAQTLDLGPGDAVALDMEFQAGWLDLAMTTPRGAPITRGLLWSVRDDAGNIIWRTSRPEPEIILSAGTYDVLAEHSGRRLVRKVTVAPGKRAALNVEMPR